MFRNLKYRLYALIYPPKCVLCKKVLRPEQLDLCDDCRMNGPECFLNRKKIPHVAGVVSVWYYKDYARRSLLLYKFGRHRQNAQYSAAASFTDIYCILKHSFIGRGETDLRGWKLLTTIPTTSQRENA